MHKVLEFQAPWPVEINVVIFLNNIIDVTIYPGVSLVTTTGSSIFFSCIPRNSFDSFMNVQWIVNGSSAQELNDSDITSGFSSVVGYLTFSNIPADYNLTSIQCEAELLTGTITYSTITTLIVQG